MQQIRYRYLIIGFLLFSLTLKAQEVKNYKVLWSEVQKAESESLPKTALKSVEQIIEKADKENNVPQYTKAFIFKAKFLFNDEDSVFNNYVLKLARIAAKSEGLKATSLHFYLGYLYRMYYSKRYYKILKRTNLEEPTEDIETWTLDDFVSKIHNEYKRCLENKEILQKTSIDEFAILLKKGTAPKELRPTLYDFFVHEIIKFYNNPEMQLRKPAKEFALSGETYFTDVDDFVKAKIVTPDSLSMPYHAIKLYQELLSFRLKDSKNIDALMWADLQRNEYVYKNSVNPQKNELYINAIDKLINKYKNSKYAASLYQVKAEYYKKRAANYNFKDPSTKEYKNDYIKAVEICKKAIEKYPKTYGADNCQVIINQIHFKTLNFQCEEVIVPKKSFAIKVNYRNTVKLYYKVAKISKATYEKYYSKYNRNKLYHNLLKKAEEVYSGSKVLPDDKDFQPSSVELLLKGLDKGFYLVFLSDNEKFSNKQKIASMSTLLVSKLSFVIQKDNNEEVSVYCSNRESGQPLKDALVEAYYQKYSYKKNKYIRKNIASLKTDAQGLAKFKIQTNEYVYFDIHYENQEFNSNNSMYFHSQTHEVVKNDYYFTDRSIYRPGQTVFFKGIRILTADDKPRKISGAKIKVDLLDANYQKQAQLELETNEYGTFSGEFKLPQGLLNGVFRLKSKYGETSISVEEYKRPKFEAKILPFKGNYRLNDNIKIEGEAKGYSGISISDAKVKYRITRTPKWSWWWWTPPKPTVEIAHGKTTTNDDGKFEVEFKALPDVQLIPNDYLSYTYDIQVDITDLNGETHSANSTIRVGYTNLLLSTDIVDELDLRHLPEKIAIEAKNLNNEKVEAKGQIFISKLVEPKYPLRTAYWTSPEKHLYTQQEWDSLYAGNIYNDENKLLNRKIDKKVSEFNFDTKKVSKIPLEEIQKLKTGTYVLEMRSKDAFGKKVVQKQFFKVLNSASNKVAFPMPFLIKVENQKAEPGDTINILLSSSYENALILVSYEQKGVIFKRETLTLNNEQKRLSLLIKESYRGNIALHFAMINKNRIYKQDEVISVPFTNKNLDIEFATFRDKLQPGEAEEWQIKIRDFEKNPVSAEMLATLYDASLDQLKPHHWAFNIYREYYSQRPWSINYFGSNASSAYSINVNRSNSFKNYRYPQFNWFNLYFYNYDLLYGGNQRMDEVAVTALGKPRLFKKSARKKSLPSTLIEKKEEALMDVDKPTTESDTISSALSSDNLGQNFSDVKVRTNFNETAFFFPHLHTDKEGNIIVKFTIPESLTKWKAMTFATTKDLKYGLATNSLVTQKDLMLNPNPPRFYRQGDKMVFPVKISNISDKKLEGEIRLEFFDALTNEKVNILSKKELETKGFSIDAGKNTLESWAIEIPENIDALMYKVVAKAGQFSDGEQKALPVLSNRMLVTESLPLNIRGNQTKKFEFKKLIQSSNSKSIVNKSLTLEFTSNPAWYAIQALPYMMEYPYECSEQTFNRFYSNALATSIANSSPKIKEVFESWKNTPNSKALLSNLEKNQELKAVLLQETPWVMDGKNETERKNRLGVLFDLHRMSKEQTKAVKKLEKAQTINGGFPWFPGMPESWYITQYIVTGLGHLQKLGVNTQETTNLTNKILPSAVKFIDRQMARYYIDLKRYTKPENMAKNHLSYMSIQYMYARSFNQNQKMSKDAQKAFDYFFGQAQKYWTSQSFYMQGMLALVLHRYKDTETAAKIIASLKENAITSDEMGMFWKSHSGWFWYQAPIETQSLLIEAFNEVAKDEKAVGEMKIWLLKQKQTQDWKTTRATAEAVYALLLNETKTMLSDKQVLIKIGDQQIDTKNVKGAEAGTGYFKKVWRDEDIKPQMGKVELTKTDKGIAWGALYWQYMEDLDKITSHKTPLKLKKELFIEKNTDKGKVLTKITRKNQLKVGDKVIVRIELRVDRDMEYVHMKDMRAACFEPVNVISRYKFQDGLGYYEETKDASTNFFFDYLRKGTYVFEYPLFIAQKGEFSNGITQIQCMYAPEFTSHSEGIRVKVE